MSNSYYFPCPHCQHSNIVETRHAGTPFQCEKCETTIEVPKLRELKSLEPVKGSSDNRPTIKAPNPLKSWMFVGGIFGAVVFGALGYIIVVVANQNIFVPTSEVQTTSVEAINKLSHSELWEFWNSSFQNHRKLPEWKEADWRLITNSALTMRNVGYGLLGLGILGVLSTIGSLFVPDKKVRLK